MLFSGAMLGIVAEGRSHTRSHETLHRQFTNDPKPGLFKTRKKVKKIRVRLARSVLEHSGIGVMTHGRPAEKDASCQELQPLAQVTIVQSCEVKTFHATELWKRFQSQRCV